MVILTVVQSDFFMYSGRCKQSGQRLTGHCTWGRLWCPRTDWAERDWSSRWLSGQWLASVQVSSRSTRGGCSCTTKHDTNVWGNIYKHLFQTSLTRIHAQWSIDNSSGGSRRGRTRRAPPPSSPNDFTYPARPPPPISPSFHKVLRKHNNQSHYHC